jgi:hypothetical protein
VTPEDGGESRFTAKLGSNARGKMLLVMLILGVGTKNKADLCSERTLAKVKTEFTLTTWNSDVFEQVLTNRKGEKVSYRRSYTQDPVILDLITVQSKAWNDSVGMCMHAELQPKLYKGDHSPDKSVRVLELN